MTTNEAAELWGISPTLAAEWCQKGKVKGAKKVMRPEWSHPRWLIPDGATKPVTKRGRPTLEPYDAVPGETEQEEITPVFEPEMLAEETVKMPDPTGISPQQYVWENQDRPIRRIANALNISSKSVTELYDQAMKMYA